MKLKHLIAWIIYFSLLASLILLMGCKQTDLDRKIDAFKEAYPDREGDCMIFAMKAKAKYDRLGIPARFCHGYWKGKRHAWVEYEQGDKWLVDDKGLGNKGYERADYTTLGRPDYELTWYGE
jgi:hypothetical protein